MKVRKLTPGLMVQARNRPGDVLTVVNTNRANGTAVVRNAAGDTMSLPAKELDRVLFDAPRRPQSAPMNGGAAPVAQLGWGTSDAGPLSVRTYVPGTAVVARVKQQEVAATLIGHDFRGQAVVKATVGGAVKRLNVDFNTLRLAAGASSEPSSRELLLRGIDPANIHPLSPRLKEALNLALDRKVAGDHTAREFSNALQERGYTVALVGGAVRDVLSILNENPDAPMETLMGAFKDIDLVTTAGPDEVRRVARQVVNENPDGAVWTPDSIDWFGVVGIGERKSGIDVATMRVGLSGREGAVFGKTVAGDAEGRDFSINTFMVLLGSDQLIDPTGTGLTDSKAKVLRPNPVDMEHNPMLSLRYLKFRVRGFGKADGADETMRQHLARAFAEQTERQGGRQWVNNFLRTTPSDVRDGPSLDAYLRQLKPVMEADGMGSLFAPAMLNYRGAFLAELEARAAGAHP